MSQVAYQYTKLRSEFGRQLNLSDGETQVLDSILPTKAFDGDYIKRDPVVTAVDTTTHMCESEVNTDRVITKNASMRHSEGGWPKDVDFTEQGDVTRYRKRVEKDPEFQNAITILGPIVEKCMRQNSTVDIYEELFEGVDTEHSSEPPSAKGLAVFRDPSPVKRTATSINWHPDGSGKLVVSYSILNFQDERFSDCQMPTSVSYAFFLLRRSLFALCKFHFVYILCAIRFVFFSRTFGIYTIPTTLILNCSLLRHYAAFVLIQKALIHS